MIKFENVWLYYPVFTSRYIPFVRKRDVRWVLKDISFTISNGETVGIIGLNGSGKSTTASLMAGIYQPDKGEVTITGDTTLLAKGLGFKKDFTGLENIYQDASLMGIPKQVVRENINKIIEFSGLQDYIDKPLKTYSNGMKSRLSFAIATILGTNNLIIDESLSTGDITFRNKAESKIREIINSGKTIIIISHNLTFIKIMCSRVIWIHHGKVRLFGNAKEVIEEYRVYYSHERLSGRVK